MLSQYFMPAALTYRPPGAAQTFSLLTTILDFPLVEHSALTTFQPPADRHQPYQLSIIATRAVQLPNSEYQMSFNNSSHRLTSTVDNSSSTAKQSPSSGNRSCSTANETSPSSTTSVDEAYEAAKILFMMSRNESQEFREHAMDVADAANDALLEQQIIEQSDDEQSSNNTSNVFSKLMTANAKTKRARTTVPVPKATTVYVRGWSSDRYTSSITIDDVEITLEEFPTWPELLPVQIPDVKNLDLHIHADCVERQAESIVDIQDLLHALFDQVDSGQLHKLTVSIKVVMAEDAQREVKYASLPDKYRNGHRNQDLMAEFRDIVPGDLSRGHLCAFLTDAVRSVRELKDGKRVGKLSMSYDGASSPIWRQLQTNLRDEVRSSKPWEELQVFCLYFDILRNIVDKTEELVEEQNKTTRTRFAQVVKNLAEARIKADVALFHELHQDFSALVYLMIDEEKGGYDEVSQLLEEIEPTLPDLDTDVSIFSYNKLDGLLRNKKSNTKAPGRSKRKAERQDVQDDAQGDDEDSDPVVVPQQKKRRGPHRRN